MNRDKLKTIFLLHILLMVYSMGSICSKLAAGESFLSFRFCLYYGGLIVILGIYALGWQQVIKRMNLTTAFANKAVTIVWGIIWGLLFFGESVSLRKILGAGIVLFGVVLYALSDEEVEE